MPPIRRQRTRRAVAATHPHPWRRVVPAIGVGIAVMALSSGCGGGSGGGFDRGSTPPGSTSPTTPSAAAPSAATPSLAVPSVAVPSGGAASGATDAPGDDARQLELAGATPDQIACFEERLEAATRAAEAGGGFAPLTVALECLPKDVLIAGERLDLERSGVPAESIACVVDALTTRPEPEVRQLVAGATSTSLRRRCGLPE